MRWLGPVGDAAQLKKRHINYEVCEKKIIGTFFYKFIDVHVTSNINAVIISSLFTSKRGLTLFS